MVCVCVCVGSFAAKAVSGLMDLGRTWHIDDRFLWLQEIVRQMRLELWQMRGDLDPADAFTKTKPFSELGGEGGGRLVASSRLVASPQRLPGRHCPCGVCA